MVEAFHKSIIFPNKQISLERTMTRDGHLLESETYVGGHVEALESGVFRADIPCKFKLDVETLQKLKEGIPKTMENTLTAEMKVRVEELVNFEDVCSDVEEQLNELIAHPLRSENPKIYHLDVGAMYPNIILTNRLQVIIRVLIHLCNGEFQPPAVVTEEDCLACVYNAPDAKCKRKMTWDWRGEMSGWNNFLYSLHSSP